MRQLLDRLDPRRLPIPILLTLPAALLLAFVGLTDEEVRLVFAGDLVVYQRYGEQLLGGATPYLDYAVEYPPLALVPMTIPVLAGPPADDLGYVWRFAAMEGALAIVGGWLLWRATDRSATVLVLWTVLVALSWASVALRYDLWPVLCVLVAVLVVERRPGLAGVALGLGTMLKLYPLLLLPVLGVYLVVGRDRAGLVRLVGGCVAVSAAVAVAAWTAAGPDSLGWLVYQRDRGLQIESLGAGLLLALHVVADLPLEVAYAFGSVQVEATGAATLAALSGPVLVVLIGAAIVLATLRFRRDRDHLGRVPRSSLVLATVATILALLVGSKVLSVQYVIWILPFVPFLPVRLRWLALAVVALSTAIYTTDYTALWRLQPAMIGALVVRNALLLALWAWVMVEVARGRELPASSPAGQGMATGSQPQPEAHAVPRDERT